MLLTEKTKPVSSPVRPKKALGQHFLTDTRVAEKVAFCLESLSAYRHILEIGPGTGVLSQFLIGMYPEAWYGMEIDGEAVAYLRSAYPDHDDRIIAGDFLQYDLHKLFGREQFAVIGNFPYNISSQILFRVLAFREQVPEMTGMFQKEVAQRIASPPGSKVYGILSVLSQAFFDVRVCFHVQPGVFVPQPGVMSSVLHMRRKNDFVLPCNEKLFFSVVKTAFNQRRKTLRNSLKPLAPDWGRLPAHYAGERPEQLGVNDFVVISQALQD